MRLAAETHKIYRDKIFPSIKHLRGATRLKIILSKLAQMDMEKVKPGDIEKINAKSWDNLIILDACRYDMYDNLVGKGDYRVTAGSTSREFIESNFSEAEWRDVVCITANPHYNKDHFVELTGETAEKTFHEIFHTYETDWNKEERTVLPQKIVRDTKTAERLFPDKKKIIHFMQPHYPFVNSKFSNSGFDNALDEEGEYDSEWQKLKKGEMDNLEEVIDAYQSNLEYVMDYVYELVEHLEGKTVITADHGNFVGENHFYGHPPNSNAAAVRKVPWHIIDS